MLRVLLVDDEPFIVQGLMVFVDWEQEGYEIVYTAADGAEALTYLKEHKVDLVISDIKMPVMSGLELLETIRRENISDAYFIILVVTVIFPMHSRQFVMNVWNIF